MRRIAIISDTHGHLHDGLLKFMESCHEVWHAGDIGSMILADQLSVNKKLVAVHGNIDDAKMRLVYPKKQRFEIEKTDVWITHIGGYPGKYDLRIKDEINRNPPKLFISGHSHILKVIYDKKLELLHINPGAAGISGFHKVCTAVRICIDAGKISDLEIWEKNRNI